MTTQEKMSFEDTLSLKKQERASLDNRAAFVMGASWAREATIAEVLGLLRESKYWISTPAGPTTGRLLADEIESKLAKSVHTELTDESEVKLKDPIYKWPDDTL